MNLKILAAMLALAWMTAPPAAHAQYIWINVSYKVVLNPADGTPPPGFSDLAVDQAITNANGLLTNYSRGYRLRRVGNIEPVGGLSDMTGPSRWYATDFFDRTQVNGQSQGGLWKDQMEAAARSDLAYRWDNTAMNLYIVAGICGGSCSFPHEGDNILVIGGCSTGNGSLQLHEMGHYFSLFHTQGSTCGGCGNGPGQCNAPGDDEIADTLPDLQCWDQDQIALNWTAVENPPRNYATLSGGEKVTVDNVFFNLMSYHGNADRLTELQLDRWTTGAEDPSRRGVISGITWFVAPDGPWFGVGRPGLPLPTVRAANGVVRPGDLVMLRAGRYNENLTLDQPATYWATRQGSATIGQ